MFVKICGITSASAAVTAMECGVDAIGFVFASSPRQVNPAQAAQFSAAAPAGLLKIAVTRHPTQDLVDEIFERLRPDYLQTDIEDLANLRIPAGIQVLPVVRNEIPAQLPPLLLFEGPVSGRGATSDWEQAAQLAQRTRLILAGGLNAGNVGEAMARVCPFGVDVSSGVEDAPGIKDARKMVEFVTAVRRGAMAAPAGELR